MSIFIIIQLISDTALSDELQQNLSADFIDFIFFQFLNLDQSLLLYINYFPKNERTNEWFRIAFFVMRLSAYFVYQVNYVNMYFFTFFSFDSREVFFYFYLRHYILINYEIKFCQMLYITNDKNIYSNWSQHSTTKTTFFN